MAAGPVSPLPDFDAACAAVRRIQAVVHESEISELKSSLQAARAAFDKSPGAKTEAAKSAAWEALTKREAELDFDVLFAKRKYGGSDVQRAYEDLEKARGQARPLARARFEAARSAYEAEQAELADRLNAIRAGTIIRATPWKPTPGRRYKELALKADAAFRRALCGRNFAEAMKLSDHIDRLKTDNAMIKYEVADARVLLENIKMAAAWPRQTVPSGQGAPHRQLSKIPSRQMSKVPSRQMSKVPSRQMSEVAPSAATTEELSDELSLIATSDFTLDSLTAELNILSSSPAITIEDEEIESWASAAESLSTPEERGAAAALIKRIEAFTDLMPPAHEDLGSMMRAKISTIVRADRESWRKMTLYEKAMYLLTSVDLETARAVKACTELIGVYNVWSIVGEYVTQTFDRRTGVAAAGALHESLTAEDTSSVAATIRTADRNIVTLVALRSSLDQAFAQLRDAAQRSERPDVAQALVLAKEGYARALARIRDAEAMNVLFKFRAKNVRFGPVRLLELLEKLPPSERVILFRAQTADMLCDGGGCVDRITTILGDALKLHAAGNFFNEYDGVIDDFAALMTFQDRPLPKSPQIQYIMAVLQKALDARTLQGGGSVLYNAGWAVAASLAPIAWVVAVTAGSVFKWHEKQCRVDDVRLLSSRLEFQRGLGQRLKDMLTETQQDIESYDAETRDLVANGPSFAAARRRAEEVRRAAHWASAERAAEDAREDKARREAEREEMAERSHEASVTRLRDARSQFRRDIADRDAADKAAAAASTAADAAKSAVNMDFERAWATPDWRHEPEPEWMRSSQ